MSEPTPLDTLHAAVQTFSNSLADDEDNVGMVTNALIVWQEANYSEDGQPQYATLYAATGDAPPAVALGLALNLLRTLEGALVPITCAGADQ